MKRRSPMMAAVMAAMLAAPAAMPVAPMGPAQVATQGPQSEKAAVPAVAPAPYAELEFLSRAGAPFRRGRTSGCPWPGRRIACARRSSGTTTRMR